MKKILLNVLFCMVTLSNVHAIMPSLTPEDSTDKAFEERFAAALSRALKKAEIKKQVEDVSTQSKIDPVAGSKMSTHAFTHAYDAALMATNLKMLEQVNAMVEKMGVKKEEPKKEEKKKAFFDDLVGECKKGAEKGVRNTVLYAASTVSALVVGGLIVYLSYSMLERAPFVGGPLTFTRKALEYGYYSASCPDETFAKTCGSQWIKDYFGSIQQPTNTSPTPTPTPSPNPVPTSGGSMGVSTPSLPPCGSAVQYLLSLGAGHCK